VDDNLHLILGGTGHYGKWIVRSLIKRNQKVRLLTRDKNKAQEIFSKNKEMIEFVEGDITSPTIISNAFNGVSTIIIAISAFNRRSIRNMKAIERDAVLRVFDEAKDRDINRIIYISVFDKPARDVNLPSGRIKYEIEETLEHSEFNYTILGAPPSMEIFFEMIRKGKMIVPGGGPPALPTIAPIDLGEITAEAVLRTKGLEKRYKLAGPEVLSFKEAAERISVYLGKEIPFQKIPLFPIRIFAFIMRFLNPLFPYPSQLLQFILLLNKFPPNAAKTAFNAFKVLQDTFHYEPTTLEMLTKMRYQS